MIAKSGENSTMRTNAIVRFLKIYLKINCFGELNKNLNCVWESVWPFGLVWLWTKGVGIVPQISYMGWRTSSVAEVRWFFYEVWGVWEELPPAETVCQYEVFIFNSVLCDMYKGRRFEFNKSKLCFCLPFLPATCERAA